MKKKPKTFIAETEHLNHWITLKFEKFEPYGSFRIRKEDKKDIEDVFTKFTDYLLNKVTCPNGHKCEMIDSYRKDVTELECKICNK